MSALVALLLTLLEMAAVLGSYALADKSLFHALVIYGSPYNLLMELFTSFSVFLDNGLFYPLILAFHLVKYAFFCRAQLSDTSKALRYPSIALECCYLGLSAYYVL